MKFVPEMFDFKVKHNLFRITSLTIDHIYKK